MTGWHRLQLRTHRDRVLVGVAQSLLARDDGLENVSHFSMYDGTDNQIVDLAEHHLTIVANMLGDGSIRGYFDTTNKLSM